jgi:hypothetical protein
MGHVDETRAHPASFASDRNPREAGNPGVSSL